MKNDNRNAVQKEYGKLAKTYDDKWLFYISATLKETLKRIAPRPGEHLLDVGCGTGILLSRIEEKYPDTILAGIDPTQDMLDIAIKRLSNKAHLKQSWTEELPFEAETFDIVVSCSMFHYIRKPLVALKEITRVLKPTGQIILTDWCDDYFSSQLYDLFLRFFNKAHCKTFKKEELHEMLLLSEFEEITIDKYKINWFWGMMTAKAIKMR